MLAAALDAATRSRPARVSAAYPRSAGAAVAVSPSPPGSKVPPSTGGGPDSSPSTAGRPTSRVPALGQIRPLAQVSRSSWCCRPRRWWPGRGGSGPTAARPVIWCCGSARAPPPGSLRLSGRLLHECLGTVTAAEGSASAAPCRTQLGQAGDCLGPSWGRETAVTHGQPR
jgi:hypothetical protein